MKDVDKKEKNYYDFPPTTETDSLKVWDIKSLGIEPKKSKGSLEIELTKEEMHESRCYAMYMNPNMLLKILAKRSKKTKKITFMIKTTSGVFVPMGKKTYTAEEYNKIVRQIEETISCFYDINNPTIVSGDELNRQMKLIVDKHKKEVEDGSNKKNSKLSKTS